jgi:predicted N-acetyltransferase YhbS
MPEILPLSAAHPADIEALLDAAFGADRRGRTAYRLREGLDWLPELSFAALDGGRLAGTLQSWPVALATPEGGSVSLVLVGPVAVAPDLQRGGVGKALMTRLIEAADSGGADAMTMIGDPEYYDRFFGFSNAATGGWNLPGPVEQHRLLARVSRSGGLPATGSLGPDPRYLAKPIAA